MGTAVRELHSTANYTSVLSLAKGGMGEVEVAVRREGDFKRLYAIKRLLGAFRDDESVRNMFLEEARIAGLIRHPNVVAVLDVGDDDDGPFLVMEYIEGVSVSFLLKKLRALRQYLPLQLAMRIIADASRGLYAAHELRDTDGMPEPIVHRDVSPQNILLGYDGMTRLTDFGVAKAFGGMDRTDSGVLKGKMGYMSPEQLRFERIDFRSDLFSLGVVLYELFAGKRLYPPGTEQTAPQRILREPPPDPGEDRLDLPPELVELYFELLDKSPSARPPNAKEVADRLDAIRTPMEADQGTVNMGDYLGSLFESERRTQQDALTRALRLPQTRLATTPLKVGSSWDDTPTVAIGARLVAGIEPKPQRSSRVRWLGLALLVALMSGAALTVWIARGRTTPNDTPPSSAENVAPSDTDLRPPQDLIQTSSRPRPITPEVPNADTETRRSDLTTPPSASDQSASSETDGGDTRRHVKRRRRRPAKTSSSAIAKQPQSTEHRPEPTSSKQPGRYRIRDNY